MADSAALLGGAVALSAPTAQARAAWVGDVAATVNGVVDHPTVGRDDRMVTAPTVIFRSTTPTLTAAQRSG